MQTEEYARMRALEDHYWWFVSRRRLALGLLGRYGRESTRVLDLGCGTGALLSDLEQQCTPTGLDVSGEALAFSRERGLKSLVRGDAQYLPFRDGSFQAVVSLDTLEHVPDDRPAVREVGRILEPGGLFVLNVPAFRWLWGPHDVALMHYRRYTRRQVVDLLEANGFRVELCSYSVFLLFPAVGLIRLRDKFRRGPAEVRLPAVAAWLNRALLTVQAVESAMLRLVPLPWGSSIVAVARKA